MTSEAARAAAEINETFQVGGYWQSLTDEREVRTEQIIQRLLNKKDAELREENERLKQRLADAMNPVSSAVGALLKIDEDGDTCYRIDGRFVKGKFIKQRLAENERLKQRLAEYEYSTGWCGCKWDKLNSGERCPEHGWQPSEANLMETKETSDVPDRE